MGQTDLAIARAARLQPISDIAARLGIQADGLLHYGSHKAKLTREFVGGLAARQPGRLILVTAMTPTPAGEGKTTTSIGLGDGLGRIGKKAAICLREPSLGPCFGIKGGAAGGGYAQVVPMEDINLHFTGDFHAVTTAHNLLSALIDNHVYWGNGLGIDARRIVWRRVMDMNDRALRDIVLSLGGVANGFPRQSGFDITVASEVMAILCLVEDLEQLQRRLGAITIGHTRDRAPIRACDLKADGAMSALLRDALLPNLVQTLEGTPALIHGGPFGNIAHGCNSVAATKAALALAYYVVTEAGFGADLGAEKFFNIKCRKAGLAPDAAVIVASARALKLHGGVARDALEQPNVDAVRKGLANLGRHIGIVDQFGVPALVAVNRFASDTDDEVAAVREYCVGLGVEAFACTHWADGGAGIEPLARRVAEIADSGAARFRPLYDDDLPLWQKARTVARSIYGADDIIADKRVRARFADLQRAGFGHYPVCMAKTQYSFSTDPDLKGAPSDHVVPIRDIRLWTGAEFLVVICGDIMTMPGLPRSPSAHEFGIDDQGRIDGLS